MFQIKWGQIEKHPLTFIEREILELIAKGCSTKQIATEIKLKESTAETYRTRMLKKFGAKNSSEMISHAYQKGLLHIETPYDQNSLPNHPKASN